MEKEINESEDLKAPLPYNVLDVRTSEEERKLVEKVVKFENRMGGSKFFRASTSVLGYSYNTSYKNAGKWPLWFMS